jgi:hypothetical protein
MKIAFYILIFVGILLYMAKTHVTMHPFSIKFENLKYAFGWVLLTGGIMLLVISSHENGVKVGAEAMKNEVIKYLDTIIEKKENKQQ